jgi:succinate dehydrogenase hydrophobic anchor subunit
MFSHPWFAKAATAALLFVINFLLIIVGFFTAKTYASIERLASEVNRLSEAVILVKAEQISRAEIRQIISEYHNSHPCLYGRKQ